MRFAAGSGVLATAIVTLAWALGAFDALEGMVRDVRSVYCTTSAPPISNEIVHLDIDQKSLDEVGRWPWARTDLAYVIDGLHEAGARAIVLDLLLDDPQAVRWAPGPNGRFEKIEDDAALAAAFGRAGNVVLGVNIMPPQRDGDIGERELEESPPVEALGSTSAALGFVNTEFFRKARVIETVPAEKTVPNGDGTARFLQLGVAAAAYARGVPFDDVRMHGDTLIVGPNRFPARDGSIFVPWHVRRESRDGPATWMKGAPSRWLSIHPHYPIYALLKYERDFQNAVALLNGKRPSGPPTEREVADARDNASFLTMQYEERALEDVAADLAAQLDATTDPKTRADLANAQDTVNAVISLQACEAIRAGGPIGKSEHRLADFADKIVFVGWNASGAAADFYPTALNIRTPGVVVHAAIADGLLTGYVPAVAPRWVDGLVIVLLGIVATGIAALLPVGRASAAMAALALGYAAVNGYVLFDMNHAVVNAAAPLIAIVAAWATCTAVRAVQEAKEKGAIRRQFRSRVSAQLVDLLADNPDLMNMEGEEREVTTMFTDFVGFTSIAESLQGTATVKLLNVYLGEITDALLAEGAYVNKFLGDGIMAFWGAPIEQPNHAARACRAAMEAIATLDRVNARPEYANLPKLGMRIGISTGKAIVGDCGAPPRLNDYTVIGDPVNLAARLESANKLVGTRVLVTARTRELMSPEERDVLAWRPLGLLRVVGQQNPQEIWELLGARSMLDDAEMHGWVENTSRAVDLFRAGDYAAAMELWQELVLFERGQSGALLYVERCAELMESGEKNPALPLRSK